MSEDQPEVSPPVAPQPPAPGHSTLAPGHQQLVPWTLLALADLGDAINGLAGLLRHQVEPTDLKRGSIVVTLERALAHLQGRAYQPPGPPGSPVGGPVAGAALRVLDLAALAIENIDLVCQGSGLPPVAMPELRALVAKHQNARGDGHEGADYGPWLGGDL